ncbi:MAG: hypothetical protein OXQ31_09455 [Spirochaetaceae bacterium]|nr:hypothetical protein [Spirochaetaceae bacterium]
MVHIPANLRLLKRTIEPDATSSGAVSIEAFLDTFSDMSAVELFRNLMSTAFSGALTARRRHIS